MNFQTYKIPSSFQLCHHTIKVVFDDTVQDDCDEDKAFYGKWNDVTCTITLYKRIKTENDTVELNEEQILNTYWHEMGHAFLFFMGLRQDEMMVQAFANLMRDYQLSKVYATN